MSIFGAALDASTGRWIAFNEETLISLSEHDTLRLRTSFRSGRNRSNSRQGLVVDCEA